MKGLTDYTKTHPMMRQQYTYLDLKAAYEEGYTQGSQQELSNFEEWEKTYVFEMFQEKPMSEDERKFLVNHFTNCSGLKINPLPDHIEHKEHYPLRYKQ